MAREYFIDGVSIRLGELTYRVVLTIEHRKNKKITQNLKEVEEYYTFSFVGSYKDGGGQCYDEILEASLTEPMVVQVIIKELVDFWNRYHLNDLKAGTALQETAIASRKKQGNKYDYTAACEYLKEMGIYEYRGYKYGHSWLLEEFTKEQVDGVIQQRNDIVKRLDLLSLTPDYERQARKGNH